MFSFRKENDIDKLKKRLEKSGLGKLAEDEKFLLCTTLMQKGLENPSDMIWLYMNVVIGISNFLEITTTDFEELMDIFKELYVEVQNDENIALCRSMLKYDLI